MVIPDRFVVAQPAIDGALIALYSKGIMNQRQRRTLAIGSAVFLIVAVFPPVSRQIDCTHHPSAPIYAPSAPRMPSPPAGKKPGPPGTKQTLADMVIVNPLERIAWEEEYRAKREAQEAAQWKEAYARVAPYGCTPIWGLHHIGRDITVNDSDLIVGVKCGPDRIHCTSYLLSLGVVAVVTGVTMILLSSRRSQPS